MPVHVVDGVADTGAAWYEDRRLTIGPTPSGKHCGFGGDTDVDGELGV